MSNAQGLSVEDYKVLENADLWQDGAVARVLSANGCANFTVCPRCKIDDYTHAEGCELSSS